ncbi:MAG: outer membrane beta-barrel protein [Chitinophagaceae bacterium]|nr:outer membrane beta-barrel protein [Chitinophagaceae bacterium]
MKKLLTLLLIASLSLNTFAQKKLLSTSTYAKPSRDNFMLQFGYETWANAPDSIKISGIGRAINAYITYDFPIQKSNFSFAAGAGVGVSNIYLKDQTIVLTDTLSMIQFVDETVNYKKYKLTTTYLEAPLEFRYFSDKVDRNKGIKAAFGIKVGTLLSTHTKSKRTLNNKPLIEKEATKRFIESYRYSVTGRLGYGNFSVYGSYALSNLFKANQGPENIRPIQIGLCITGL